MQINKNHLYILGIAVILIFGLFVVFYLTRQTTSPAPAPGGIVENQNVPPQPALPGYVLDQLEEGRLRQFVSNFISLYNSYSYQDTGNLLSQGDYETEKMQNETIQFAQRLDNSLKPGDAVRTEADETSFAYDYPESAVLYITMSATVTESHAGGVPQKYSIVARVEFQKTQSQKWLVNGLTITKP